MNERQFEILIGKLEEIRCGVIDVETECEKIARANSKSNAPAGDNNRKGEICPDCGGTGIGSVAYSCNEIREYDCVRCHGSGKLSHVA